MQLFFQAETHNSIFNLNRQIINAKHLKKQWRDSLLLNLTTRTCHHASLQRFKANISSNKLLPCKCTKDERYSSKLKGATETKFVNNRTTAYASNKCTTNEYANYKSLKKGIPFKTKLFSYRHNRPIHYAAS